MKLFKTKVGKDQPLQEKIYIEVQNGNAIIKQVDSIGFYTSHLSELKLPDGKYAIDKVQFFNILKVMKDNFSANLNKKTISFISGETTVKAQLLEYDLQLQEDLTVELKEVPDDFLTKFRKGLKFTSESTKNPVLRYIFISGNTLYSSDGFTGYKGILNGDMGIEGLLPLNLLDIIPNPLRVGLSGDTLVVESKEGTAKIRLSDGQYPFAGLDKVFNVKIEGTILAEGSFKALHEALSDATNLGHKAVHLETSGEITAVTEGSPDYKRQVLIKIPESAKYTTIFLSKVIISENTNVVDIAGNSGILSIKSKIDDTPDEFTFVLPLRSH